MQQLTSFIIVFSIVFFMGACSKDDDKNNPDNRSTGIKYPYFTVGTDTYGGVSTLDNNKLMPTMAEMYGTTNGLGPFPPCAGQTNYNYGTHKNKFQEILITDTIKMNTVATFKLQTGSLSNIFKLKGNYQIPTSSSLNPNLLGHGSCPDLNTCGKPNTVYYNHETYDFLYCLIEINGYSYYIYQGTYSLPNYNNPLSGSFTGKAYKAKQQYSGSQNDLSYYDTTKIIEITAKFN